MKRRALTIGTIGFACFMLMMSAHVNAKYIWITNSRFFNDFSSAKAFFCSGQADYYNNSNGRYSFVSCSASGVTQPYWNYLSVAMDIKYKDNYYPGSDRKITGYIAGKLLPEMDDPNNGGGSGSCGAGEGRARKTPFPVDIPTGNKNFQYVDFQGDGAFPIVFAWNYNSREALEQYNRAAAWNFSYSQSLQIRSGDTTVLVKRDDGKAFVYTKNSTGLYLTSDRSIPLALTKLTGANGEFWKLHSPGSFEEYYDDKGRLLRILDVGTQLQHRLTHNGYDVTVTHSLGYQITLHFAEVEGANIFSAYLRETELSQPKSITTPVGEFEYNYNASASNRIERVFYTPNASVGGDPSQKQKLRTFLYENTSLPLNVTRVLDERDFTTRRVTYDSSGRALSSSNGTTGQTDSFQYVSSTKTKVTNTFGYATEYNYQNSSYTKLTTINGLGSNNCSATTSEFRYDAYGRTQYTIDKRGNVEYRTYYDNNLPQTVYRGGTWTGSTATFGANAVYSAYTYTASGLTDTVTLYGRNAAGTGWSSINTVDYDYWPNNRLKQITQTDTSGVTNAFSTSGQQRIISYSYTYYNGAGLPVDVLVDTLTMDGPLAGASDTTAYKYDPQGRLLSITNAPGQVQQFADFDGRGQPQTITDANGVVTALGYHPRGWLETVSVKDPGGNSGLDATTTYTWYPNGTLEQLTFPDGSYLHYDYNDARHLTEIRNNLGEKITYTPNAMGEWVASKTYDTSATMKRLQTRAFDELGRLMDLFGNNGQQTHYGYDTNNNLNTVVESGDNRTLTTTMNHDTLNRLKSVLKPVTTEQNGSATTVTVNTQYGYDAASNLTSVTDPKGNVTRYVYNGFGDKITQTSPDTGVTQYGYDALGNLTDSQDGRGVHVQYHHDVLGRLTWIEYPTSSDDVHYYYDEVSAENPYASGRLTRITDGTGSTQYRYDHRGNIVGDLRTIGTNTFETRYTYNLANNLTSVTYPGGRIVSYARSDVLGRVTGLSTRKSSSEPEQTVLSQITYLPFGPVTQFAYGNGLTRQVPYDLDYRIDQILVSGNVTALNLDYGYDAFNNITSIFNGVDNVRSETFSYDDLHRLQHAYGFYLNGNGQMDHIRYEYDPVGNRTTRELSLGGNLHTAENYSYDPLSNQLNSVSRSSGGNTQVRSLLYGDSGHLASETTAAGTSKTYTYNDNNRLIELAEDNIVQGDYRHNALGQRVSKTTGTSTTHYLYGLQGELLAEASEEGQVLRQYLYLNGQLVGVIDVTN